MDFVGSVKGHYAQNLASFLPCWFIADMSWATARYNKIKRLS
jgi:hypothetical protein